jgi:hypothetical protein
VRGKAALNRRHFPGLKEARSGLRSTGKSSPTISAKPVGVGAASQRLIPPAEQSGLQTPIAMTESVSLCTQMKY